MNCNCTAKRDDIEGNKQMETSENAGFTLVEVMLAMAILAILTISLLNYFGTSLAYNTKMAASQKATLLAQEIAEELKGQDTLIQPDGTSKDVYTVPYLSEYEVTQNNLDAEGKGDISFKGDADKLNKNYDVTIDVKSGKSAWDKAKKMYGFDNTNSILAVDESQDDDALLNFKSVYASYCDDYKQNNGAEVSTKLTDAEIKSKIKRTIDIEISKGISETEYTVNIKYIYVAAGLNPADSSSSDEKSYNILSGVKISELKNLFILYHTFNQNDYMNIKNMTTDINIPDKLYLVAQKRSASDSLPANYKMYITGLNVTKLYSNIGTGETVSNNSQILKKISETDSGSPITPNKLSDDDFASVHTVNFKVSVYEKGKAGVTGAKPYITIDGTKGEKP
ncbi:prepilin-type N-terminal cleavage/methylation domain-containing protein [Eubacterium sp. MSJ-13]|uniref:prepilin-type N-terminal cleavage/methylation domain-containing protein n=1 Tax=Eubacterium sp. MSJ-13 TaxID=2841513 RepID=UPI001C10904C|nr:prepilin-type N-terminal cleavage/methylation domain-containing protein [Eubacterium sp. MSJ-13]MBU5478530.1 prepilin-type N-terminal cleavage/methylation domain-containing protein [Eubacterium sp. MSJ-13]